MKTLMSLNDRFVYRRFFQKPLTYVRVCRQVYSFPCLDHHLFWRQVIHYGRSFVAKLSSKKIFFWKNICAFTKCTFFAEKNVFIWKKSFTMKKFFYWKNYFYREKLYLISEIYFYTENICVTNKIWIFLKFLFILQFFLFFDDKKYIC